MSKAVGSWFDFWSCKVRIGLASSCLITEAARAPSIARVVIMAALSISSVSVSVPG